MVQNPGLGLPKNVGHLINLEFQIIELYLVYVSNTAHGIFILQKLSDCLSDIQT